MLVDTVRSGAYTQLSLV